MNEKTKKVCKITLQTFSWLLLAFAAFIMIFTIVTVSTVDRSDRAFLGRRFFIVQSDSMSASERNADMEVHFNAGDIIFSKIANDPASLGEGSIISFVSTNSDSYGKTLTHMIREVKRNSDGELIGYVTFGTNTDANDETLVTPDRVLGVYDGKLAGVGSFFAFVKTTAGYLLCVFSPFILLIAYNAINVIRSAKSYKEEKNAYKDAQKAELDAKIKENEELLRKLEELKQELAESTGKNSDISSENGSK